MANLRFMDFESSRFSSNGDLIITSSKKDKILNLLELSPKGTPEVGIDIQLLINYGITSTPNLIRRLEDFLAQYLNDFSATVEFIEVIENKGRLSYNFKEVSNG